MQCSLIWVEEHLQWPRENQRLEDIHRQTLTDTRRLQNVNHWSKNDRHRKTSTYIRGCRKIERVWDRHTHTRALLSKEKHDIPKHMTLAEWMRCLRICRASTLRTHCSVTTWPMLRRSTFPSTQVTWSITNWITHTRFFRDTVHKQVSMRERERERDANARKKNRRDVGRSDTMDVYWSPLVAWIQVWEV